MGVPLPARWHGHETPVIDPAQARTGKFAVIHILYIECVLIRAYISRDNTSIEESKK
ncbi:hypothetical protein [Ostreiculturibacter nitratireducens]|uniref:hypothetical protein n=1 Tax=Ostreiculturibacter nitratireducens TaxID=3075226 RepID=UPI0031B62C95